MNYFMLIVSVILASIIVSGAAFGIIVYFSRRKLASSINIAKGCSALERRRALRNILPCKAYIKKINAESDCEAREFEIRDISNGGTFIVTNHSLPLVLGDEVEVTIELGRSEYYRGKARIVHSQAVFDKNSDLTESGIGIKFLSPPREPMNVN
jgi:hypothetical protein